MNMPIKNIHSKLFKEITLFILIMAEPKITLEQYKKLRELEGEMGVHLDIMAENFDNIQKNIELEKSFKIIQNAYKKFSDISEEIRKTTGIDDWD